MGNISLKNHSHPTLLRGKAKFLPRQVIKLMRTKAVAEEEDGQSDT